MLGQSGFMICLGCFKSHHNGLFSVSHGQTVTILGGNGHQSLLYFNSPSRVAGGLEVFSLASLPATLPSLILVPRIKLWKICFCTLYPEGHHSLAAVGHCFWAITYFPCRVAPDRSDGQGCERWLAQEAV